MAVIYLYCHSKYARMTELYVWYGALNLRFNIIIYTHEFQNEIHLSLSYADIHKYHRMIYSEEYV